MFNHADDILNIDQFCELLDVGKSTGYKLLKSRRVKAFKVGKKWKIPVKALEDFVLSEIKKAE